MKKVRKERGKKILTYFSIFALLESLSGQRILQPEEM